MSLDIMQVFQGYRKGLSARQQYIYDSLKAGILKQQPDIEVPQCSDKALGEIFEAVLLDHPEIFYTRSYCAMRRMNSSPMVVSPEYTYSQQEVRNILARCRSAAERLIKYAPADEYGRERYVHDLLLQVTYGDGHKPEAHSMLGPLLDQIGVCEGISKAAKYLYDLLGMRSMVVFGVAKTPIGQKDEAHSWNFVGADGSWHHVDITFDNSLSTEIKRYDYFNLSDEEINRDHNVTKSVLTKCTTSANGYYRRVGLTVDTEEQLANILNQAEEYIAVKFPLNISEHDAYAMIKNTLAKLNLNGITVTPNISQMVFQFRIQRK